jgi:hypothetical protein
MSDTVNETYREPQLEDWSKISWSAIIFGTLAALAVSITLHVFGLGVAASSVDTNAGTGDALSWIGGMIGIWFLASTAIGLFVGGFIASTLAHTFTGKRAAIYGIGVWALSTLITMSVLVPALVNGVGNAISTGGTIIDRAGSILSAGGTAVQAGQNAPSGFLEGLQKSLAGTPTGQVDQAAVQDIARLIGLRFTQGELTSQQHDQLVNDVTRVAGISPDDARRRVDEAQNTIKTTLEQARQKVREAAEATRQAVSKASYSAFAAMIVGLVFALLGANYGELDEENLPRFARIRLKRMAPK